MPVGLDDDSRARERVGTVLSDKWTLERLLGVGGMAAVYSARHRNGARAAVKVLHPSVARHAEVRERFRREGYAANRVEHPGVVKVLDDDVVASGPDEGTAFLVMELLEGESLQDRIERQPPVPEVEFLRLAEQVLDVLEVAHARGVVHRDLKPENLFLVQGVEGEAPRIKVLDFGLARLLDGQAITSYGLALGTPSFMSPEQAAGRIDEIDGRTDLFALGATGFRVRTGRRIHEAPNPVELVVKMSSQPARRIRDLASGVSEPYARVIDRALEFKRTDRYPDAASMRQDVRRALAELEGHAPTVMALEPVARPAPAAEGPPPSEREPTKIEELSSRHLESTSLPVLATTARKRRRSWLVWVPVLLGGAAAAAFGWLATGHAVPPWVAQLAREARPAPEPQAEQAVPPGPAPSASHGPVAPGGSSPTQVATVPRSRPPAVAPFAAPASASGSAHVPRPPPARLGPGNVHALPAKHR